MTTYILYNNRQWVGDNNTGVYYYGTSDQYTVPANLDDIKAMGMSDCGAVGAHTITYKKYLILAKSPQSNIADVAVFDLENMVNKYPAFNTVRWCDSYSNGVFTSYEMMSTTTHNTSTTYTVGSAYTRPSEILVVTPTFNLTPSTTAIFKYTLKSIGADLEMAVPVNGILTSISTRGLVVHSGKLSMFMIIMYILIIIIIIVLAIVTAYLFYKKFFN